LFENPVATYVTVWELLLELFGSMPNKFQIVDSAEMMLGVVANGQGYTFVPRAYVPDLYLDAYPIRLIPYGLRLPRLSIHLAYSDHTMFDVPPERLRDGLISRIAKTASAGRA